jgi:hypothetical protein
VEVKLPYLPKGGESYERIQKVIREIKIFDFIMKYHYKIIKEASSILL